jgi:cysteine-S-conjugate beta-lyase
MPDSLFEIFDSLEPSRLRDRYSRKWNKAPADVLPLWIADMDFPVAPPILEALHERLKHPIGYLDKNTDPLLLEKLIAQAESRGWTGLEPSHLWLTHGVVQSLYMAVLGLTEPGDEVITQTPIYPPFLNAIRDHGRVIVENPMVKSEAGWELDVAGLERLVTEKTKLVLFCNPQNPTGRVFRREELEKLADFVVRHGLYIASDEVHADLILDDLPHIPLASLNADIARRTVTISGPSKSYNTAGVSIAIMIAQNRELLLRLKKAVKGLVGETNVLSTALWLAGLEHAQDWLAQTRTYIKGNRDCLSDFLRERLPKVAYVPPEGTYLAWLDFRAFPFADEAHAFMLERAKVELSDGKFFGGHYDGYLRLNLATSRKLLTEALMRMEGAIRDER